MNRLPPITANEQLGMGLVEVLVALLLLSAAALGYTALQAQSLSMVDESVMQLQALLILDETTERIRANQDLQDISHYQQLFDAKTAPSLIDCVVAEGCSGLQVARNDVSIVRQQARAQGIRLAMVMCPGTQNQGQTHCLVAAWNDTVAGYATTDKGSNNQLSNSNSSNEKLGNEKQGCFHADGSYLLKADCIYREAF